VPDDASTGIVMLRDLSAAVEVGGDPTVWASLVLDRQSGLVLAAKVATAPKDALSQALETALAQLPGTLQAQRPGLVLCADGLGDEVRTLLARLVAGRDPPPVRDTQLGDAAEDVFDALVGHLAGRRQPEEPPAPEDWAMAFEAARAYRALAPWERWSDAVPLDLELDEPASRTRYVCVVLGAEGVQRGLAVYPGDELPAGPGAPYPDGRALAGPGVLVLFLDRPSELPADLVARALRYGWPPADEVVPAFLVIEPEGPAEPSRRELQRLAAAAAAVTAHDRRGPIVVGPTSATTGEMTLSDGGRVTFSLSVPAPQAHSAHHADPEPARQDAGHGSPAGPSIADLFAAFLADQRSRLAPRTWRKYESMVELLSDFLNGYGHQSLDPAERRLWEAVYEHDEHAFVQLFGADKVADNLGGFLGHFMIRKVAASEDLLRTAGTVTKKLALWLAQHGYLSVDDARGAAELGGDAARELPRAERLARLLHDHARRAPADAAGDREVDFVEDCLVIERVEPGVLWFERDIGPVEVPEAASALAQPGWSLSVVLARRLGRWQLVDAGSVYP